MRAFICHLTNYKTMKHKRFDMDMFDLTDSPAREATKQYIARKGYTAIDNPDKYCADLIVEGLCFIECECKLAWRGPKFPWPSVHLPQRKKKFANLSMPVQFYIWNKEYSHAMRICGWQLTDDKLIEVPNKMIANGEYFYNIPTNETHIISKD